MEARLAPVKGGPEQTPDRARFIMALCFNLVPLAGVTFWGWSPFELIFLYWLENVVIGLRTLIMILLSGRRHGAPAAIALGVFFSFHYGLFCLVHGVFVIGVFGGVRDVTLSEVTGAMHTLMVGVAAVVAWQVALLILSIVRREDETPGQIMSSPYPRIIVLHITILAGGFLLMALGWPHVGVIVLALVKTVMDAAIALFGWRMDDMQAKKDGPVSPPSSRSRP